jgi:predicted regulator of Ras-like GTPase activity (Roadblock/LC7/MglB family)
VNTARTDAEGLSAGARNLRWLLSNLVTEVPGVRSVAVVSSDGFLLASSEDPSEGSSGGSSGEPRGKSPGKPHAEAAAGPTAESSAGPSGARPGDGTEQPPASPARPADGTAELSTVVSGLASLTDGAARLMDGGPVKQTVVTMDDGHLFVMAISDGSLLGVHAAAECDLSVVAYHMALFVGRAGHVLTPELRVELRRSLER